MLEELFLRSTAEICSQNFNRLTFLKLMAQLAPRPESKSGLLVLHSLYQFLHHRNLNRSLECVELGLSLKPEDATVSMLLSVKGAVLTHLDKHAQALHILKEAFSIASGAAFIEEQPHIRKGYPQIIAKVLDNLKLSRGKRQFLVFLDGVRVQAGNLNGLQQVYKVASLKVAEIREQMRCGFRQESEDRSLEPSSYAMNKKQGLTHTSIYISRLYEQRKMKLSKRDNSNSSRKVYDPYQWRAKQKQSESQCQYM